MSLGRYLDRALAFPLEQLVCLNELTQSDSKASWKHLRILQMLLHIGVADQVSSGRGAIFLSGAHMDRRCEN